MSGNSFNCFLGRIIISNQNAANATPRLEFCHKYPEMNIFPDASQVNITSDVRTSYKYEFSFAYSVIDFHLITTVCTKNNSRPPWGLYFPKVKTLIYSMHIVGDKFRSLTVQSFVGWSKQIFIFDGPGSQSELLKPVNTMSYKTFYFSTSFQCLIFFENTTLFTYIATDVRNISSVHLKENTSFEYFSNNMDQKFEHIKFVGPQGLNINCSVTKLVLKADQSSVCSFAGLAAYDVTEQVHVEHPTICTHHSGLFHNRNFYSQTSKFLAVLYSYEAYAKLSAGISVTLMQCKPVPLDICRSVVQVNKVCFFQHQECMDKMHTNHDNGVTLTIKQNNIIPGIQSLNVEFLVSEDDCHIFQLYMGSNESYTYQAYVDVHCIMTLHFTEVQTKPLSINYVLSGYLPGESFLSFL